MSSFIIKKYCIHSLFIIVTYHGKFNELLWIERKKMWKSLWLWLVLLTNHPYFLFTFFPSLPVSHFYIHILFPLMFTRANKKQKQNTKDMQTEIKRRTKNGLPLKFNILLNSRKRKEKQGGYDERKERQRQNCSFKLIMYCNQRELQYWKNNNFQDYLKDFKHLKPYKFLRFLKLFKNSSNSIPLYLKTINLKENHCF